MKTASIVLLLLSSAALAAPPGNGGIVPPAAPEDALYANNLVVNPGFERGGPAERRERRRAEPKIWYGTFANGMEAKLESAAPNKPVQPFEGRKALRVFVKEPAKYAKKALLGDWEEFDKGANGGKGPPTATLFQLIPVKPGQGYALRFRWRASGLYNVPLPGPDRGVVAATVECLWLDEEGRLVPSASQILHPLFKPFEEDAKEWTTAAYPDFSGADLPWPKAANVPFVAPQGASFLRLKFSFFCRRPKVRPEIWIDRIEVASIQGNIPLPNADPAKPAAPAADPAKPVPPAAPTAEPAKPAAPAAAPATEPAKPAPPAGPAAPAPETSAKEGGVLKLRDCGGAEFLPAIHLAGWKGSAKLESLDPAVAAALAGFFSYMAGDVRIRGAASFAPQPDGALRASWTFTPQAEADLALLGVCLRLAADGFAGGSLRLDGVEVPLPAECGENPRLFSGTAATVAAFDKTGRERFSFSFDAPTRVSLQDNRFWKGSVFEFRIHPQAPSPYPAGVGQSFSLSLRGGAPAAPAPAK